MNAARSRAFPRAGIGWGPCCGRRLALGFRGRGLARLVLRGTLGHHAISLDVELVAGERALEHDLGAVFERVGHDAGVTGANDAAVALDVEAIVERIALALDVL